MRRPSWSSSACCAAVVGASRAQGRLFPCVFRAKSWSPRNNFAARKPTSVTASSSACPRPRPPVRRKSCTVLTCLGQLTLPFLSREEFLQNLRLQLSSLFVKIGSENVACQTFVASQCRGLLANAILTSPTSLARCSISSFKWSFAASAVGRAIERPLVCPALNWPAVRTLIAVMPQRHPRRIGGWTATWLLGDRPLATQRIRAISQQQVHPLTSLIGHAVRGPGRQRPLAFWRGRRFAVRKEPVRVGPCFLVSSSEPGMAGLPCTLRMVAQVPKLRPTAAPTGTGGPHHRWSRDGGSRYTLDVADLAQEDQRL